MEVTAPAAGKCDAEVTLRELSRLSGMTAEGASGGVVVAYVRSIVRTATTKHAAAVPPASELEAVPLPAMASSVVSQVTEFVRGVLDPLYRAAMVTKEQYKVIVRKLLYTSMRIGSRI
ncbi:hypothetical protein HaLaN_31086 [Haematococcus lacustris]|uniref:Uncharacterized protein n=1 Tax=Haematococcus lacustris TaxID=44745 RepID=A0A6A0AI15_HAELA|nr:hypothetical protein HaLaN_31086 [Haematococcus lacustris]